MSLLFVLFLLFIFIIYFLLISFHITSIYIFKDQEHQIFIYNYDKEFQSEATYLKKSDTLKPTKETFCFKTFFCSTKLTHNLTILKLLNWKDIRDIEERKRLIKDTAFIDRTEIINFLPNIFDALFAMLNRFVVLCVWGGGWVGGWVGGGIFVFIFYFLHLFFFSCSDSTVLGPLVFDTLVSSIAVIYTKKSTNFRPVMEAYVVNYNFTHLVFDSLLRELEACVAQSVKNLTNTDWIDTKCRATLASIEYIFKFIIRSFILHSKSKDISLGVVEIKSRLASFFTTINDLMSLSILTANETANANINATQHKCLDHFPSILSDLLEIYSQTEVGDITRKFIESAQAPPPSSSSDKRLPCIHDIVKSSIFLFSITRQQVLPVMIGILQVYICICICICIIFIYKYMYIYPPFFSFSCSFLTPIF